MALFIRCLDVVTDAIIDLNISEHEHKQSVTTGSTGSTAVTTTASNAINPNQSKTLREIVVYGIPTYCCVLVKTWSARTSFQHVSGMHGLLLIVVISHYFANDRPKNQTNHRHNLYIKLYQVPGTRRTCYSFLPCNMVS